MLFNRREPIMQDKLNCWEYNECGREPGGYEIESYGICPTSSCVEADGLNGGKNGGRICWAIAGTFVNGKVTGKYACDKFSCINCDFFKLVSEEEGVDNFEMATPVQMILYKTIQSAARTQHTEKRSSKRFPLNLNSNFICSNRDYTGTVTNISETGMFISSRDMSFPNEAKFEVQLDINNECLNLPVKMCRLTISPDLDDGMGVEILNPPQNYLILIDKLRTTDLTDLTL